MWVCMCVCMCVCIPEQCSDDGALVVFIKHQGEENRAHLAVPTNVIAVHLRGREEGRTVYDDIMVTTHGNGLA